MGRSGRRPPRYRSQSTYPIFQLPIYAKLAFLILSIDADVRFPAIKFVFALQVKYAGQIIWSKLFFEGREEGYYKIQPTAPGAYAFCFSNEMSRFTVKTVRFDFSRKSRPKIDDSNHAKAGTTLFMTSKTAFGARQEEFKFC